MANELFDPTGWELALVTAPSSDISSVNDRKLVTPLTTLRLNYISFYLFILAVMILLNGEFASMHFNHEGLT